MCLRQLSSYRGRRWLRQPALSRKRNWSMVSRAPEDSPGAALRAGMIEIGAVAQLPRGGTSGRGDVRLGRHAELERQFTLRCSWDAFRWQTLSIISATLRGLSNPERAFPKSEDDARLVQPGDVAEAVEFLAWPAFRRSTQRVLQCLGSVNGRSPAYRGRRTDHRFPADRHGSIRNRPACKRLRANQGRAMERRRFTPPGRPV
jgi:hypothetical protein